MKKVIELRNVSKQFDGETVLDSINLDIYDNEFLTLLGPSGCGKTTTLRMIGGFETPDQGDILFLGERINDIPPHKRNINTVFQRYALFPHLNVFENVAFPLREQKLPRDEIEQKVNEMLALVKLTGFERRNVTRLSGGQQQRVAIARALVSRPRVLLLDEPLAALDLKLRKDMQQELKNIQKATGITFVFVTHDQEEALSMSDAITTAKLIIKQQAYESGCHASFMPKPLAGEDGSAMFLCQSLFDHDGNNVFWGEGDEKYHLSDVAKHYMAGILAHAREISAITNPTVNSYKRITTGGDSVPQYATWGLRNRASMVRIPVYKPGKQLSTRIELRSPDPMANPYLVNAVTLAAGLDGIERKLELPPEATAETLKLTDRQMVEAGYTPLPRSLKEALDVFEDSQFMKDALGEHIHSFFLKKKRDEWHKFESTITEWEIKHYLANS